MIAQLNNIEGSQKTSSPRANNPRIGRNISEEGLKDLIRPYSTTSVGTPPLSINVGQMIGCREGLEIVRRGVKVHDRRALKV